MGVGGRGVAGAATRPQTVRVTERERVSERGTLSRLSLSQTVAIVRPYPGSPYGEAVPARRGVGSPGATAGWAAGARREFRDRTISDEFLNNYNKEKRRPPRRERRCTLSRVQRAIPKNLCANMFLRRPRPLFRPVAHTHESLLEVLLYRGVKLRAAYSQCLRAGYDRTRAGPRVCVRNESTRLMPGPRQRCCTSLLCNSTAS